jgi:glycine hydroxymethyltransferase
MRPSGVRIGTPAVTSRGFGTDEMIKLAAWMERVAAARGDLDLTLDERRQVYREIATEVRAVCDRFPAPGLPQ